MTVPNVSRGEPHPAVARVEVDKNARLVRVLDPSGRWLAAYPASIGSKEKPAPSGVAEIKRVARNPTYHYDPHFGFKGVKTKRASTIAEGPNNPVGAVWIDLSIESYGIHGTPELGNISATEELASMVQKGTKVNFMDEMADNGEDPAE